MRARARRRARDCEDNSLSSRDLKPAHDDAVDARGADGRDESIATNGTASLIARASRSLASGARQGVVLCDC